MTVSVTQVPGLGAKLGALDARITALEAKASLAPKEGILEEVSKLAARAAYLTCAATLETALGRSNLSVDVLKDLVEAWRVEAALAKAATLDRKERE